MKLLRLKLKAAKGLLRDLTIACARAEEALEREAHNAQPKEAKRDQDEARILVA